MDTLTDRTAAKLTRQILDGRLDAKEGLITERVLCKRLRVSRVTVRRALSQLLRCKMVKSIPNKGYVLGPAALAQSAGSGPTIARDQILVINAPNDQVASHGKHDPFIRAGLAEEARKLGFGIQEGAMSLEVLRQALAGELRNALLGVGLLWKSREAAELLLAEGIPGLLVEHSHSGLPMDSIVQDDDAGIAAAMGHLWNLGHRRIALIAWSEPHETPLQRRSAFRAANLLRGVDGTYLEGLGQRLDAEGGREATRSVLERHPNTTALLVANQTMLPGVLDILDERGLAVGRDMSLVVWGSSASHSEMLAGTRWAGREFDAIAWSPEDMGRMAVRMLALRERDPMQIPMTLRLPLALKPMGTSTAPKA